MLTLTILIVTNGAGKKGSTESQPSPRPRSIQIRCNPSTTTARAATRNPLLNLSALK
jgi:hypothetical protein